MTSEAYAIADDARRMCERIDVRIVAALDADDVDTIKWLHKRIVSIERASQEREVKE